MSILKVSLAPICVWLVSALSLTLVPAHSEACVLNVKRAQHVIELAQQGATAEPLEKKIQQGDLITLVLPAKTTLQWIRNPGSESAAVQQLTEEHYQTLTRQTGARTTTSPAELLFTLQAATGSTVQRAGAARSGYAYVRIRFGARIQLLRFDIAPANKVVYGYDVPASERTDADTVLALGQDDTLMLELPGTLTDGWTNSPVELTGFRLVSITALESNAVSRVQLRFKRSAMPFEGTGVIPLQVRNNAASFDFKVIHRPPPVC